MLPDFVVIGAQKGGTTSLYKYLTTHPSIGRALRKEVHYFDLNHWRGVSWYRAHFPSRLEARLVKRRHGLELRACEASPYYLFHPEVPSRMRDLLPEVKLIVLLREPVERALSHYHQEVRLGREQLPVDGALARESERLAGEAHKISLDAAYESFHHRHHSYLSRGAYADQLEVWLSVFKREQLLVMDSSGLADPAAMLQRACDFLGLPTHSLRSYERFRGASYPAIEPALERQLREHFAPHNRRLWTMIGESFDWDGVRR